MFQVMFDVKHHLPQRSGSQPGVAESNLMQPNTGAYQSNGAPLVHFADAPYAGGDALT